MGERLAGDNTVIALLANALAGATLITLFFTFGPISGARFNPAVRLADASQGGISWSDAPVYIGAHRPRAVSSRGRYPRSLPAV
jgi:glycerol uptake facilitator-like aquaporin